MQDSLVCCTSSVAIGQKAFNNYNGIGIHVCYSPQPVMASQWSSSSPTRHAQVQPPPMLAVVLDASMETDAFNAAVQSLWQAVGQLNPETRLLLMVYDQVVKMVDLKTSKPQTWVVHGLHSQGAAVLPQIVRAADIRATPLAHCEPYLSHTLATLQHFTHQQSLQQHLSLTAAAVDIALFLLTASVAAWDAQHKPQQQRHAPQQPGQQVPSAQEPQPMHNARVMLLTSLPNSSTPSASAAQQLMQRIETPQAQQLQQMFNAIASKAASLDIPVDVITGSIGAPAALMLRDAVTSSHGRLLHQPGLSPPLASNIAAIAQSRFGWEGVLDIRVPHGVKVVQVSGPVSTSQTLPKAAHTAGVGVPVLVIGPGRSAAVGGSVAAPAPADTAGPEAALLNMSGGPISWSNAATAVPVVSSGSRFVAVLEFTRDWEPGSSIDVEVVCEWTAGDGRRVRQVCSHNISVTDRLTPFIEGLDVPAVVLLMAQRLVAAAAAAALPTAAGPLRVAAAPKPRAIEDGRLSVGMALAHVAQRVGHAHTSKWGLFGIGSQQVWQLPDDLIPLALSLYQLQRSNMLDPSALDLEQQQTAAATDTSAEDSQLAPVTTASSSGQGLMYGSWKMLVQQFTNAGPDAALRMVAPWLYVFDSSSRQFEVLPPLNLALEPDALAVLDCGSELIIYVGEVLEAMVEGVPPQRAKGQQQQETARGAAPGTAAKAATTAAAAPPPPTENGNTQPAVPDMAVAAAPAVQFAHQLIRGRVPVSAIRLIEDIQGMASLMQKLIPLHEDPMALQMLLLPHLKDLAPAQHGYLLDWHRHWAAVPSGATRSKVGYASGGARLAATERDKALSFGQWYSSYGVVLRSPRGTVESEAISVE